MNVVAELEARIAALEVEAGRRMFQDAGAFANEAYRLDREAWLQMQQTLGLTHPVGLLRSSAKHTLGRWKFAHGQHWVWLSGIAVRNAQCFSREACFNRRPAWEVASKVLWHELAHAFQHEQGVDQRRGSAARPNGVYRRSQCETTSRRFELLWQDYPLCVPD